jgi:hypothetical protein
MERMTGARQAWINFSAYRRPTFASGEQYNYGWTVILCVTVFCMCSLVCWLSGAQRDVCSGLLSGAQHDVLHRTAERQHACADSRQLHRLAGLSAPSQTNKPVACTQRAAKQQGGGEHKQRPRIGVRSACKQLHRRVAAGPWRRAGGVREYVWCASNFFLFLFSY